MRAASMRARSTNSCGVIPVSLTKFRARLRVLIPTTSASGGSRGRIASPRMLLDNFSPMTGTASPNRFGVVDGGKDQHGRAARGRVGGDGALPVGQTDGEGGDPRRAVRDDGLESQACGARVPATRAGWVCVPKIRFCVDAAS